MEENNLKAIIEELEKKVDELKVENEKLKKQKKKNKRPPIKTPTKEIVDYWEQIEDECDLSVD